MSDFIVDVPKAYRFVIFLFFSVPPNTFWSFRLPFGPIRQQCPLQPLPFQSDTSRPPPVCPVGIRCPSCATPVLLHREVLCCGRWKRRCCHALRRAVARRGDILSRDWACEEAANGCCRGRDDGAGSTSSVNWWNPLKVVITVLPKNTCTECRSKIFREISVIFRIDNTERMCLPSTNKNQFDFIKIKDFWQNFNGISMFVQKIC